MLNFNGTSSFAHYLSISGGNVNITSGTTTDSFSANPNIFIGGANNTVGTLSIASGATFNITGANQFTRIGSNNNSVGVIKNAGTMSTGSGGGANFGFSFWFLRRSL